MFKPSIDVSKLSDDQLLFIDENLKHRVIKYDSNGVPLYYVGNNTWSPAEEFVSREDILKAKARYPKPRIYPFTVIRRILTPFLLIGFVLLLAMWMHIDIETSKPADFVVYGLLILAFYIIIHLSDIAIFAITIYQKTAKDETRERCQLTPTCSFYGIYSFQKYGFVIGLIKTIMRLHRCEGQEGVDEP